jgi:hypothetical protein
MFDNILGVPQIRLLEVLISLLNKKTMEHSKQYLMSYKRNRYTGHMPLSPGGNK